MSDAIIKVSWRRAPDGSVAPSAQGGICGTCFTLESGITISCAHNMQGIFVPNEGYDVCRVFIAERSGSITELNPGCIALYPEYDACVIHGYQSTRKYSVPQKQPNQIASCCVCGYEANVAPFRCQVDSSGQAIEIVDPQIAMAKKEFHGVVPEPVNLNVTANDINISDKRGYIMHVSAPVGVSGSPMVDEETCEAVALCILGLPPDVHVKTKIGAIDLRQFPFLNS
jgi:hypothetical protein